MSPTTASQAKRQSRSGEGPNPGPAPFARRRLKRFAHRLGAHHHPVDVEGLTRAGGGPAAYRGQVHGLPSGVSDEFDVPFHVAGVGAIASRSAIPAPRDAEECGRSCSCNLAFNPFSTLCNLAMCVSAGHITRVMHASLGAN